MSIPDPILNCRAPQAVKDALHLTAKDTFEIHGKTKAIIGKTR